MRVLVLMLLWAGTLLATQEVTVGIGPYVQSQPYKGASDRYIPSPVVFFDNSLLYVRWSRVGVYFMGDKKEDFAWGLSVTAQPRTLGYKPEDAPILNGMEERKSSLEGGLAFSAKYHDHYVEVMLLHDLMNNYNSWLTRTELGTKYSLGEFNFYPSVVMLYFSKDFMNYYYGVRSVEATPTRAFYEANSGFEFGVQSYISYPFTKNLSALLNLRYDILPSSARRSPLVEDNYIYSGLASLIYKFTYH